MAGTWQDEASRDLIMCDEHDNQDDAEKAFLKQPNAFRDGIPFGRVRRQAALVGGGDVRCQHPDHHVRPEDLLDQGDLARLLGVAASSLASMRSQPGRHRRIDGLPAPIRTVGNAPVWDRRQVEAWLAVRR